MEATCVFFFPGIEMNFFLISQSSYWLSTEATLPEYFVINANRDLVNISSLLASFLPALKARFVMDGIETMIPRSLISMLQFLEEPRINSLGRSKLLRNLVAFQQNFANIPFVRPLSLDHMTDESISPVDTLSRQSPSPGSAFRDGFTFARQSVLLLGLEEKVSPYRCVLFVPMILFFKFFECSLRCIVVSSTFI